MSMLLMVEAMKLKVGNPLRKLVLIKLADNASDKGECFPSIAYIADQCEISERSVQNHIKQLEADGLLKIESRKTENGLNRSNIYYLNFSGVNASGYGANNSKSGANAAPSGESAAPHTGANAAPRISHSIEPVNEPVNEPVKEPKKDSKKASQISDDFEPNDHHVEIAQGLNLNLDSEFIKFKDYCLANGKKYVDWNAGFNNWLRNAGKFQQSAKPNQSNQKFMTRFERNMAVLNSMRGE